jgi:peptidoglycan hydrolase CwlO-like protein
MEKCAVIKELENKSEISKQNMKEVLQKCNVFQQIVCEIETDMSKLEEEISRRDKIISGLESDIQNKEQEIKRLYSEVKSAAYDCQQTNKQERRNDNRTGPPANMLPTEQTR